MRRPVDESRLRELMRLVAMAAREPGRIYLTGGATAVLRGWRISTVDVDIRIVPESAEVLRALPDLKERLNLNIELASPADFIPELPGWQDRSPFIAQEGKISFHHYDFYAQCLAKIERGHRKDRRDIDDMIRDGLVDRGRLLELFERIEPELYRYPAIDPPTFRRRVEAVTNAE